MNWARDITTGKASSKSVLIALADFHHDKNNTCYPSIPAIVQFTELNHKTVREALKWLEKAGFITVEKRAGTSTNYYLNFFVTHSIIGRGSAPKNPHNLVAGAGATHSKNGRGGIEATPPSSGTGQENGTPSKNGHDPFQKRIEPLPRVEHEQENRRTGLNTLVAHASAEVIQLPAITKPKIDLTRYLEAAKQMWIRIQPITARPTAPNLVTWAKEIERIVRIDERPIEQVWKVFDWANRDPFWQSNILSPSKLRKQFDALHVRMQQGARAMPQHASRRTTLEHDLNDTSWAN